MIQTINKKNLPLVSVIITTYNRPEMLIRACKSVFSQTYRNIEIIIVDDNSTVDFSYTIDELNILSPFPIKFIKNSTNRGACYSRNKGIKLALGDFITGLDDDDEFTQERIDYFVKSYDPKFSFVSSNAKVITKNGSKLYCKNRNREIKLDDMLWSNICGTQIFIEKNRIIKSGGFDEKLSSAQDADMWLRLIELYGPSLRLGRPTFILHTEHESGRISDNKIQGMRTILEKHRHKMNKSQINFREFKIEFYKNKKLSSFFVLIDLKITFYLLKNKILGM